MGVLDGFKQDCIDNPNVTNGDSALQEEINKQMKAIADYDANPEILDAKIKFNPEVFDYNERKISKQLYVEEDCNYPEADDPEELLKETMDRMEEVKNIKARMDEAENTTMQLEQCECNEVKVGDKIIVYDKYFGMSKEVEVTEISKAYDVYTFEPVPIVMITYNITNMQGETSTTTRKLDIPCQRKGYFYYNKETKEEITQLTLKNEKQ